MDVTVKDAQRFVGEIHAYVFDGDLAPERVGPVLDDRAQPEWSRLASEQHVHNLVTNVGRQQMTAILVNGSTRYLGYMGLSTSAITPALTDTALTNEIYRGVLTLSQAFGTYYQRYVALFAPTSFGSTGIAAEGLFDTATTGGNMWADGSITVSKTTTQALVVEHRIGATT